MKMHRFSAAAAVAVLLATGSAHATLLTQTSLSAPSPLPGTTTAIAIQGVLPPSQATLSGPGYTVTLSTQSDQGVVHGTSAGRHAIPIAGTSGGSPTYLTGDFGSGQTTDPAMSGNYFSTDRDNSSIDIAFATKQAGFSLLWGSVDFTNELDFYDGATLVGSVTGTDVQNATPGFAGNGNQSFGGSIYVTVNSTEAFDHIVAHSGVVSFEFAGAVASTQPISTTEPFSLAVLGTGLIGLGLTRARKSAV